MARKIVAEFDAVDGPFVSKLRAIDQSIGRFEKGTLTSFARVEKGMNSLVRTAGDFRNVTGLIASGLGVNLATDFIDQATRIRRALSEAGASGQEDFEKLFLAANRSLAGMNDFAQGTQRMQKALAGRQGFDATLRDMETLNKLLILGGKTTQERMSTMLQFSQALQAGVLQGDELRSLRENAPIELMQAIAEGAGGTIESLKKLGEEGKLTTDVMMKALKSLEAEADARMKGVTLTISEAATVLSNGAIVATEGFDKGLGLSRATVSGLKTLGELLGKSQDSINLWNGAIATTTTYAEAAGKAIFGLGTVMATSFAGRKIQAGVSWLESYGPALKKAAEDAQAEQVATRAAANSARESYNRRRAAMDGILRLQDDMVAAARAGAVEEAKAATASRHAAEIRAKDAASNVAATQRQIAATEAQIAAETRLRQLGFRGTDRRELYGDGSFVRKNSGGMSEEQFANLLRQRETLQQKLAAFDAQRIAADRAVTVAAGAEAAKRAQLDTAGLNAVVQYDKQTKAKRATLAKQLAAAENALTVALERQAVAANAVSAANARLSLTGRAVATAGTIAKGAWAFLGGWPGLILLAGTAFLTLGENAESAADRFERLTSDTGTATGAADALRDVQSRLNEAIAEAGKASDVASQKIVANTRAEMGAKRDLLKLENQKLEALQAERKIELNRLVSGRDRIAQPSTRVDDILQSTLGDGATFAGQDERATALAQAQREFNAEYAQADALVTELRANIALTGGVIAENNVLLVETATKLREAGAAGFEVRAGMAETAVVASDAVAAFNELLAAKEQEADLQRLINQYGEDSAQVALFRAAAEREAYEQAAIAKGVTGDLLVKLMEAYDAAVALSSVNLSNNIIAALGPASELAASLWDAAQAWAAARAASMEAAASVRKIPGGVDAVASGDVRVSPTGWRRYVSPKTHGSSGGGVGGGKSKENKDQEEALRFVEEMMTAEEKRAKQLSEMVALRERLVKTYGPEADIVAKMDEAITRFSANLDDANSKVQQIFDIMSDNIANAIEDWKGFGSLVKSILADLVRQHGVAFFTSLLMPGKQSGDDLGTWLGNAITGQLHTGGSEGNRNARSIPAAAFIGAPRFHNGLLPDEFTAILQKGETVLPKGVSPFGSNVSLSMPIDMRGADPAMIPYIDGKVAELKREFPGRVLQALTVLKDTRKLR